MDVRRGYRHSHNRVRSASADGRVQKIPNNENARNELDHTHRKQSRKHRKAKSFKKHQLMEMKVKAREEEEKAQARVHKIERNLASLEARRRKKLEEFKVRKGLTAKSRGARRPRSRERATKSTDDVATTTNLRVTETKPQTTTAKLSVVRPRRSKQHQRGAAAAVPQPGNSKTQPRLEGKRRPASLERRTTSHAIPQARPHTHRIPPKAVDATGHSFGRDRIGNVLPRSHPKGSCPTGRSKPRPEGPRRSRSKDMYMNCGKAEKLEKRGDLGRAIAYYKRAFEVAPQGSISKNLKAHIRRLEKKMGSGGEQKRANVATSEDTNTGRPAQVGTASVVFVNSAPAASLETSLALPQASTESTVTDRSAHSKSASTTLVEPSRLHSPLTRAAPPALSSTTAEDETADVTKGTNAVEELRFVTLGCEGHAASTHEELPIEESFQAGAAPSCCRYDREALIGLFRKRYYEPGDSAEDLDRSIAPFVEDYLAELAEDGVKPRDALRLTLSVLGMDTPLEVRAARTQQQIIRSALVRDMKVNTAWKDLSQERGAILADPVRMAHIWEDVKTKPRI